MKEIWKIIIALILIFAISGSILGAVLPPFINRYKPMRLTAVYQTPRADAENGRAFVTNGAVRVDFDLSGGRFDVSYDGHKLTGGAFFTAVVDGKAFDSRTSGGYMWRSDAVSDEFGSGVALTASESRGGVSVRYFFNVYDKKPFFISGAEYVSEDGGVLSSNDMRQVYSGGGADTKIGNMRDVGFLLAPYDNDKYVKYVEQLDSGSFTSYEFSMFYNSGSREGIVFGSVDHDAFKSAAEIDMRGTVYQAKKIKSLQFHHGVADYATRDFSSGAEHGFIHGETVASPRVFYGYYGDYRDGLEEYGDANADVQPMLEWSNPVPVGFNTWAGYGMGVTADDIKNVSDYINKNIAGFYDERGCVYVNADSGWNGFSEEQLREIPGYLAANGQKAGIYMTPFSAWSMNKNIDKPIYDGADYTWRDIVLKDKNGGLVSTHEDYGDKSTLSLDLTHPGTRALMEYNLRRFFDWGYEFIKMDFIIHGAVEGDFYDKTKATTGIMAYNYGMRMLNEYISDKEFTGGRDIFLSAAISPIFPSGYMHARRISCDVFENYGAAHYRLNSHTYAWWQNGRLYKYNDPDHVVFSHDWEKLKLDASEAESEMVMNSALISGTLLLWSDDISRKKATIRAEKFFNNSALMETVWRNEAFRPAGGGYASEIYYSADEEYLYVAVFNLDEYVGETFSLDLSEYGFNSAEYEYLNLNTGKSGQASGNFTVKLKIKGSTIIRFGKISA
ncbi:MAG: hypothetical protein LBC13_00935 [Clostridiales bacterium]|jgi:hypothetical protein|nr:hypothetical protein [Clostridiales bacterium]